MFPPGDDLESDSQGGQFPLVHLGPMTPVTQGLHGPL